MLNIEQKYKDLYTRYGGKSIRLVFYKEGYRALYPSETLYPSDQLYPSEMDADKIAFEITDEMIHTESLTITESLCSEENLDFGACESARLEIIVSNIDTNISGKEFALIEEFADCSFIRGFFTVDSTPLEADKNTRKIIAYDRMKRFNADVSGWYNAEKFPMTLKQFRDSLCEFVGVTQRVNTVLVNDEIIINKTLDVSVLNGRDVIRYICQINGVFGNIDRGGELRYVSVPVKNNVLDRIKIYQSVESEEYTVPDIDTVVLRDEENAVAATSSGNGNNLYIIEGNFLVYGKSTAEQVQIANNIKSVVSNLEYRPTVIITNGYPWYEVGDRIEIETNDGIVNTVIMSRILTGIQGAMDEISSKGTQKLSQTFSIKSQIVQANGLTAVIKRTAGEVSNELKNSKNNAESKFTQMANLIQTEVTRAKEEEGKLGTRITQTNDIIEREVTRAKGEETKIGTKITQTESTIKLQVSNMVDDFGTRIEATENNIKLYAVQKGQVSSQLSVETGGISIKGDRFSWSATNSSMTKDGTLACNNITATKGTFSGRISGSTITGENSIIGSEIKGQSKITAEIITGEGAITGGTIESGKFIVDPENETIRPKMEASTLIGAKITGVNLHAKKSITAKYIDVRGGGEIKFTTATAEEADFVIVMYRDYFGESDKRLKDNIYSLNEKEALDIVLSLNPVSFKYINIPICGMGFIAQEVENVDKDNKFNEMLYKKEKDGYYTIPYDNYIALLVSCVKSLKKQLDFLKGKIDTGHGEDGGHEISNL